MKSTHILKLKLRVFICIRGRDHSIHTIWVQCRGGWTRSRESEKNALIALGRANQDVDLSSSLPSLAGLQLQDALEI